MTVDITRHQGGAGLPLVELASKRKNYYRVRTDLKPYESEEGGGVTFVEKMFPYKPTLSDVKEYVFSIINAHTDIEILSGFVWNDINVWLSEENQRNFSEAHKVALFTEGRNLPITFKLGENVDGSPIYHTFDTIGDLTDFYLAAVNHIQQCLNAGWSAKDNYDFSSYEIALDNLDR